MIALLISSHLSSEVVGFFGQSLSLNFHRIMFFSCALGAAVLASVAVAAPASPTATDKADVLAAQATAKSESPVSHVKGKAFDRYVSIWFENTDYDMAANDPNFAFFMKKGITLTNNFAVTHPSEPNYMAAVGGDYFGLDGDPFTAVPGNVSSVVDLLEDKGISWGLYQEDMYVLVYYSPQIKNAY